ncbi:hypothetical protein AAHA92_15945 [Salvia divinorum]|uniref:Uncharacterized protein n=1 Tax=Salvia divinorum TaxID=28513 RepID=A0ABD1GTY1_SALDI
MKPTPAVVPCLTTHRTVAQPSLLSDHLRLLPRAPLVVARVLVFLVRQPRRSVKDGVFEISETAREISSNTW